MAGYKLTDSMRNRFYCEREQLRRKIEMIREYLTLNHNFLCKSKLEYERRLDNCKDQYELFLAEDDSTSNFTDFEQIYLNGCLMYLISQYEYYIKEVYKEVCVLTKNPIIPFHKEIVNKCTTKIKDILNLKLFSCTSCTLSVIGDIIKLRNQLVHADGKSYNYHDTTQKHFSKYSNKIKLIKQSDERLDVYLTPEYILYVCNIIQYSFFSLTKSTHKKLKACNL